MSDRVDQDDVIAELDAVEMQEWLDSLDDAGFLGIPHRVHGPGAHHEHLPGAF